MKLFHIFFVASAISIPRLALALCPFKWFACVEDGKDLLGSIYPETLCQLQLLSKIDLRDLGLSLTDNHDTNKRQAPFMKFSENQQISTSRENQCQVLGSSDMQVALVGARSVAYYFCLTTVAKPRPLRP